MKGLTCLMTWISAVTERGRSMSENGTGYVGIDKDYFVSVKEVLNITAEMGALETQNRVRELSPADVVEVVRCKDCKYLKPFTSQYGAGQFCECPCSFGGQGIKKPDDYCSYGERRDDREYNNSILNARKGEE